MTRHFSRLELDGALLGRLKGELSLRIAEGLARDGGQIRALPAWLGPPARGLAGRALVLDTGGTRVRAALLELFPRGGQRVLRRSPEISLPAGRNDGELRGEEFFDIQARLLASLNPDPGMPLGFCFSYPSESLSTGDARLLRWTKGVRVSGVEGTEVGSRLVDALGRRRVKVSRVRVLNDTVAALLAGARQHESARPGSVLGLVLATGTNMAAFVPPGMAPKLSRAAPEWSGSMAFNMESGNFHPPGLCHLDDLVDAASENPGRQRFEKAVSGFYLPRLLRAALPPEQRKGAPGTGEALVALRDSGGPGAELAGALLRRSAHMVAAAVLGLADAMGARGPLLLAAEGGLFWGAGGYSRQVARTLARLDHRPVSICRTADANLLGAACAALGR